MIEAYITLTFAIRGNGTFARIHVIQRRVIVEKLSHGSPVLMTSMSQKVLIYFFSLNTATGFLLEEKKGLKVKCYIISTLIRIKHSCKLSFL